MSEARELLERLEASGATLTLDGRAIDVQAAAGVLTDKDRRALYDLHAPLVRLLRLREIGPTEEQADRIRAYGRSLGHGGPDWAEQLLEPGALTRDEADRLLNWLHRRAAQDERQGAAR